VAFPTIDMSREEGEESEEFLASAPEGGRRWETGRCRRVAGAERGGELQNRLSFTVGLGGVGECGYTREYTEI